MNRELPDSSDRPLDESINYLSQIAESIINALSEGGPTDLEASLEQLSTLSRSLSQISHKVARQIEERDNHLALVNVSQVINSSLHLDEVLRIVMDTIVRLTGAERGFLMLRDADEELRIHVARNWEQETLQDSSNAFSRTVVDRVLTKGQPILTTNARQDPRFDHQESVISLDLRSILCVPLKLKAETIGVIYADNRLREGLFTEGQKDLLAAFANQAAIAIENARLFESIESTLAEVTELKNLMDDVFSSITSGVITTDMDNRITLTNDVAAGILDVDGENLIGRNVNQVPLLEEINIPHYLARVLQFNQHVMGLQFNLQSSPRDQIHLRMNLSPLKNIAGDIFGATIVIEDVTETHILEAQQRLFERMVAPAVINQLNPDDLNLGGSRKFVTTLFADIRGFTSLSEECDPETLVSVLNRYLGAATEAILLEEGTIDKFMGDAIMAFFNAPIPQPNHTLRAVRAALNMRTAINAIHVEFPPEFRLDLGIGIHYGEAILGLIGTQKRLDYTAIGDSVNTAKRLQENAAPGQILISSQAYELIQGEILAAPIKPLNVKGKKQLIHGYELTNLIANYSE